MCASRSPDISVELCGLKLANPTVLASGVLGVSRDLIARVAECGAGAAVIKSISPQPREGHHNPTVIAYEAGMLNAVGYSNPGADEAAVEFHDVGELPIPVFASAVGRDAAEFAEVAAKLERLRLQRAGGAALLSAHARLRHAGRTRHASGDRADHARRARGRPTCRIFVKLSPNVPGIGELALAAVEGGADGISAVNTLGPGMVINVEARQPVLDFRVGGVSGPALRPVAVRCVYDVATALRKAGKRTPIIGIGGVAERAGRAGDGHGRGERGGRRHGRLLARHRRVRADSEPSCGRSASGWASARSTRCAAPRWRGGSAMRASLPVMLRVEEVVAENAQTATLYFRRPDAERAAAGGLDLESFVPGQFFMVWLPRVDEKPYAISHLDAERLALTAQQRGPCSTLLCEMKPGDQVGLRGPFGRGFWGFDAYAGSGRVALIGGGCGMAVVAPLSERLPDGVRRAGRAHGRPAPVPRALARSRCSSPTTARPAGRASRRTG